MKLGIQLFGAMDLFRAEPSGFLDALAAAGYTEIEPCVAFGTTREALEQRGIKPVWLPEEFNGFRKLAEEKGLSICSCHVFGDPQAHRREMADMARDTGLKAFVLGCTSDPEAVDGFVKLCREIAVFLQEQGLELWLHNSWKEIYEKPDGKPIYQAVLEACDGDVGAQMDVGWVQYAGVDPLTLMEDMAPYLKSLHYKDIAGVYGEVSPMEHPIQLGKGLLHTAGVKKKAEALGIGELIDQDASPTDLLEDLVESAKFLKNL